MSNQQSHTHTHTTTAAIWLILLMLMLRIDAIGQCSEADIEITSNTTWQDQTIELVPDQKIVITDGAKLTVERCTLTMKSACSDYWDGIHLVTDENGNKAELFMEECHIEFSKNGIQAANGFEQIELLTTSMIDNGQMIDARDSWPFTQAGPEIGLEGGTHGPGNISLKDRESKYWQG